MNCNESNPKVFGETIEFNNEDGIKSSKNLHPTLRMVEKQMKGFPEELVMYVYHHLNGREEDARTYLEEWETEQEQLRNYFHKVNDIDKLSNNNISNGDNSGEHPSSNTDCDNQEQGIHPAT